MNRAMVRKWASAPHRSTAPGGGSGCKSFACRSFAPWTSTGLRAPATSRILFAAPKVAYEPQLEDYHENVCAICHRRSDLLGFARRMQQLQRQLQQQFRPTHVQGRNRTDRPRELGLLIV